MKFRVAYHLQPLSRLIRNGFVADGRTDFRSFGIHQYGDAVGHCTHIINQLLKSLIVGVCRVHTHHVHAGFIQAFYKINFTTLVRDGCNNLRLL